LNCESKFAEQWDWKHLGIPALCAEAKFFRSQRKYYESYIGTHLAALYFWLLPKATEVRKDVEQTELAQKPFLISSVWSMVLEGSFCRVAINSRAGCGLE
jgi:hypothetical protein